MSKLSLKKKADKTVICPKITGFFAHKDKGGTAKSQSEALTNITNVMPLEKLVQSPVENVEEIVSTPDSTALKRKRREETSNEENKSDRICQISPVHKRRRPSKECVTKLENHETLILNNIIDEVPKNSCKENEEILSLFEEDDDDDLFACLADDSFSESSNVKSLQSKTELRKSLATSFGRHKVLNVQEIDSSLILSLHEDACDANKTLTLKGSWINLIVNVDDTINVDVEWSQDNTAVVDDGHGLVILHPDTLVSGTAIVSAMFCMRKAYLSEKFKGQEGGNRVMLIGTAVHELLQEVVKQKCYSRQAILSIMNSMMESPRMLSDILALGLYEGDIRKEVEEFIVHIQYFVKRFILGEFVAKPETEEDVNQKNQKKKIIPKDQWKGKIVEICDIEENFWSPRLGVKGKIDLTVKTENCRGEINVEPLELKTGKATHSSSHQGQVMLYCMMSGDRRQQARAGLLLYLRSSDMTQVPAGHHEQRGLVQLRNELVSWMHNTGGEIPDPISHQSACQSCGLLDVCTSYQVNQKNTPAAPHPMSTLVTETTAHLTQAHFAWFQHWTELLDMEFQDAKRGAELKDLWCLTTEERESRCQAVSGLTLETVSPVSTLTEHRFVRDTPIDTRQGLVAGEMVVVSTDKFLAVSQGIIQSIDARSVIVTLDKDITKYGTMFHLDRYIYTSAQSSCYVGLAKLLSDNAQAARLREACIDFATPTFLPGLGREVAEHGRLVLKSLNKIQQRAVIRSIMSERYSLIRGMPGTGKTTTIVGLVRLLAKMGQSVLIVAYTNSAVDTILSKLQQADQTFLRLGRKERVKKELWSSCAETLMQQCSSVKSLGELYKSYHIVASTCLAVNHPATANRQFDWCICDEASQALLPSVIPSLMLAKKFILVGDHAQLPPTVQSARARSGGLDQSLFSILDNKHPSSTCSLTLQYRMNSRISDLANHLTYDGKLECGDDSIKNRVIKVKCEGNGWISRCLDSDLGSSAVFVDTAGLAKEDKEATGIFNSKEANLVQTIVSTLTSNGFSGTDIGVIAPYSAQVKFIKAEFHSKYPNVEVGTVDQYQGRDKMVIVYTCTRSNISPSDTCGDTRSGPGHILQDTRRLNVAITRAKAKLIIIGDKSTLVRDYKPFQKLINFFDSSSVVRLEQNDILTQ